MNKKRFLAMVMAVAMVVSMLAGLDFTVYADTDDYYEGKQEELYVTTGDTVTLTAVAYKNDGTEWDLSSGYTFQWCEEIENCYELMDNNTSKSITITVGDWYYRGYMCEIYKDGTCVAWAYYSIYNEDNYIWCEDTNVITSKDAATTLSAVAYDNDGNIVDLTSGAYTVEWYKEIFTVESGIISGTDIKWYYYEIYDSAWIGSSSTVTVTPTSDSDFVGYIDSDGNGSNWESGYASEYFYTIYKNDEWMAEGHVYLYLDETTTEEVTTEESTTETTTTTGAAVGSTATVGNLNYKVTKAASGTTAGEVTITSVAKKSKKVTIPDTVTISGATYKVTAIADNAFKGNSKMTSLVIGSNVTTIGKNAFKNCKNLTKVSGGKALVTIKANAFVNCKKLKRFTCSSTKLKTIGNKAFYKCKKLATIKLSTKNLKKVGKKAISGIKSTATIKVPKTKLKAYKKLFKKKTGFKSTMKIKKK